MVGAFKEAVLAPPVATNSMIVGDFWVDLNGRRDVKIGLLAVLQEAMERRATGKKETLVGIVIYTWILYEHKCEEKEEGRTKGESDLCRPRWPC